MEYYRIEDYDNSFGSSRSLVEFMKKIEWSAGNIIGGSFWDSDVKTAYLKSESFDKEKFDELMTGSDYTVEKISKDEYFEYVDDEVKRSLRM